MISIVATVATSPIGEIPVAISVGIALGLDPFIAWLNSIPSNMAAYRVAVGRARSFRKLKMLGREFTDKPMIRRITTAYSDSQDWRFVGGAVKLRTHLGRAELCYRSKRLLHR